MLGESIAPVELSVRGQPCFDGKPPLERIRRIDAAGFSLAELMVVVAVVGILTTIGVPYLNSYYNAMKLRSGADELATLLNSGRYLAIKQNGNVCVSVSGNSAQYLTGTSATCGGGTVYVGQGTQADGSMPLQNTMRDGDAGGFGSSSTGRKPPDVKSATGDTVAGTRR